MRPLISLLPPQLKNLFFDTTALTMPFKYLSIIFSLLLINNLWASDNVQITNIVTKVSKPSTYNKEETYVDLISKTDISKIIAPEIIGTLIPFNKNVGIVTFSVLSPKKSKMYLKWDNPDYLYSRAGKVIKFRRAGDYKSISFNATKPMTGYIYLMNSRNKVLKRIRYNVKKQSQFSHSVRTFIKNSDSGNNTDQDMTISYSLSKRSNFGQPRWNMGVSTSTDLDDNNSKSLGVSFGYSW